MTEERLGFVRHLSELRGNILIPKYHDPTIVRQLDKLRSTRRLYKLGDLIDEGNIEVQAGHEVGKMAYGTGNIPFVRTSDLANWEIKTDPKQGVSREVFDEYSERQDVASGDVLFVRDGTYLIGTCAMVTDFDIPMVYQSHVIRLKTCESAPLSSVLLLTALSSPIVRRQIRARQFTADIIDTIGNRYHELLLPVPIDEDELERIEYQAAKVIVDRARLREELRRIPYWAQGLISSLDQAPTSDEVSDEERRNSGFIQHLSGITGNTFIPKYYDPRISLELNRLKARYNLLSIGDLLDQGMIEAATGIEVGKMAYGTGPVPFVRTSDMSNWELKDDPKQRVAEELYLALRHRTDVRPEDVFVVRDGTYLVGTSGIVGKRDSKALYCGGLYKLRSLNHEYLDPYLLLALLNTPIVRLQMRSKQFTRDIIDTLGRRLFQVVLPVPRDSGFRCEIAKETRRIVETRARLREEARQLAIDIEGAEELDEAEQEIVEVEPL